VLNPRHVKARNALGMAYQMLGRIEAAAQVYRDWLKDEPGQPEALHHLAACSGEGVPDRAPDAYVETVFDGFANSFDAKLAMLDYRAPELIAQAVASLLGEARRDLAVLDAGCGTGLCGPLLAPYARRLDGVDLSERMLAKAEARQVYDTLAKAELTAFIDGAAPGSYELIVSADTLCYFGDLQAVARAAAKALQPEGRLVFTVEASAGAGAAGFQLNPHGRYSHREAYLREVLAGAGFADLALQPAHLRTEAAKPVHGWVVSCKAGRSHSS
jgi:predicted TPR repeat methyltransferase